jgi:hypothetical protein
MPTILSRLVLPFLMASQFITLSPAEEAAKIRKLALDKVWVKPGEANLLRVDLGDPAPPAETRLRLRLLDPWGRALHEESAPVRPGQNAFTLPARENEGGFLAEVTLDQPGAAPERRVTVHSVVRNLADDLRYGFYAKYNPAPDGEVAYAVKSDLFAENYVNAVEYYDYFAQHGRYALRESMGEAVGDVVGKLGAGHARNIKGIAYIAAYAADPAVYREIPHAMTDEKGVPRMFSDLQLTTEEHVLAKHGRPTGLYLTAVADDTAWYAYIMKELRDVVANPGGPAMSFDGFEIDTYGDAKGSKFYAKDSRHSGQLLSKVLKNFVGDVRDMTHQANPSGLVSFNCVSEFGIEEMYDVTDFLFIELWHWRPEHASYQALVDTCFKHRAPANQRVVIKIYPTDMKEKQALFPVRNLRLALGAMMTGAGSLMVLGEPLEDTRAMQALSTMIYQQCVPLKPGMEAIVRDYYRFDALYYGLTHGKKVNNLPDYAPRIPSCIVKAYEVPEQKLVTVQILHTGPNTGWGFTAQPYEPLRNQRVTLPLPAGKPIQRVTYASPDSPDTLLAKDLAFTVNDNRVEAVIPELNTHGVLFLHIGEPQDRQD